MKIANKILYFLTKKEKNLLSLLLIMTLIMAFLDMIGVASILPFMSILINPGIIETNVVLNNIFETSKKFGIENNQDFLFYFGLIVFLLLIFSLTFKALTSYLLLRFVNIREYSIGKRLLQSYLCQPYSWFLNRHSADFAKTILSEVSKIVSGGVKPLIELIVHSVTVITLLTLLILTDIKLAIVAAASFGSSYLLIYFFINKYLHKIGRERLKSNQSRFTILSDAFGTIKHLKLGQLEQIFINLFSGPAFSYAITGAYAQIIRQLPRYFLEAIAFGGILVLILFMMMENKDFIDSIPIISLYIFAGYRLLPAIQNIYGSLTQLKFIGPSVDKLYHDIKKLNSFKNKKKINNFKLKKSINLNNIEYKYPKTSNLILKNITLTIPAKKTVGFVGSTGSGKTTLIDIILGLLEPNNGNLEIDGTVITKKNISSWQNCIGYVPQNISLVDDTISANIAFGVDSKEIDIKNIERVSKIANLHEFIIKELPKKYQTAIGENGIRLSGGQRQRIGIARALYHYPQILVLDEATSSLDNQTEENVIRAINKFSKNITTIMIAHRLNTVKNCDIIFKLKKGQIVFKGSFNKLLNNDKIKKKHI